VTFPSRFMLAAAMSPCPLRIFWRSDTRMPLEPPTIQRYVAKISGPFLDRVDMQIEVPSVKYKELRAPASSEVSAAVRTRVMEARKRQHKRHRGEEYLFECADGAKMIRRDCAISADREMLLENAVSRLGLSARAHDRILKVSRTIADLDDADSVEPKHLSEAIQY
jgi:magnesium chelatase family protein